jgi:hypothetical protein
MKHVMIVMALLVILVLQASMAHGAMQPPIPSPPTFPEPGSPSPSGAIDESIANRLTIGMSDSEVFAFAGPPKFPVKELTMASRWVYVVGDDLLELTFGSGQIVQVKRFRQQATGPVQ